MEVILGVMQFICIGVICIIEFNKRSPAVFLWATLFLMFGIMHLLATIQGDVTYSEATLNKASLFVICFSLIYFLTRYIILRGQVKHRYESLEKKKLIEISGQMGKNLELEIIVIFLGSIFVKLCLYISAVGGLMNTSWGNAYKYGKEINYLNFSQVTMVLFIALSGIILAEILRKRYKIALMLILVLILNVVITRNRVEMIPVLSVLITVYIINVKRIKIQTFIFIVCAAIGTIYIVYGLRAFRWYGTLENFIQTFKFDAFMNQINTFLREGDGELGLRRYMYYFISNNNNFTDFSEMATYKRMLMVFIPTKWSMGLKPDDFAISMGKAVGLGEGGSMHPTLFGDCYANAGFLGIFLGIYWAMFVSFMDKILIKYKDDIWIFLLYITQSYMYVIIGRGAVYNGWLIAAYGMIVLGILHWLRQRVYLRN